jgi:hypothetical protein
VAAYKGKIEVLDILWVSAKDVLTPEDISNKFLLARDDSEQTAWHVAAKKGNTELWQQLQEWATKNVATEELNVVRFISKCHMDHIIWQVVAENGRKGLLEKM